MSLFKFYFKMPTINNSKSLHEFIQKDIIGSKIFSINSTRKD